MNKNKRSNLKEVEKILYVEELDGDVDCIVRFDPGEQPGFLFVHSIVLASDGRDITKLFTQKQIDWIEYKENDRC